MGMKSKQRLPVRILMNGFSFVEVPITVERRRFNASKSQISFRWQENLDYNFPFKILRRPTRSQLTTNLIYSIYS